MSHQRNLGSSKFFQVFQELFNNFLTIFTDIVCRAVLAVVIGGIADFIGTIAVGIIRARLLAFTVLADETLLRNCQDKVICRIMTCQKRAEESYTSKSDRKASDKEANYKTVDPKRGCTYL